MNENGYDPNAKDVRDFWKENFNMYNGVSYLLWKDKSYELKLAGELLYEQFEQSVNEITDQTKFHINYYKRTFGSIWMMLSAYSIECLLKGMIYCYTDMSKEGQLNIIWRGTGHDLVQLVEVYNSLCPKEHSLSLTPNEIDFFHRMSEYSLWAGKYPAPKSYINLIPKQVANTSGFAPRTHINVPSDKRLYEDIFEILTNIPLDITGDTRS